MRVSSNGNPEYRVHYVNWKSKWDEWVDEARVLKFNSTNLKKEQVRIFYNKLINIKRDVQCFQVLRTSF